MQDINDKINNMHMGKLIHMLSHEMKRNQPIDKVIKAGIKGDATLLPRLPVLILRLSLLVPAASF